MSVFIDLRRTGDITPGEHRAVSGEMQALLMSSLMAASGWGRSGIILHGGNSLRFRWGSPRFSEDLDFMVSEERFSMLDGLCDRVMASARLTAAHLWKGCELRCRADTRSSADGRDVLHTWDMRWYHPNRRGKIMVKAEFYRTNGQLMESYGCSMHSAFGRVGRVDMNGVFAVPALTALWGDKVKAVATRPAFKWRDAYDLGFLRQRMEAEGFDEAAMREAVLVSAAVYGKNKDDMLPMLRKRLAESTFSDDAVFVRDMGNWFSPDGDAGYITHDYLHGILRGAGAETERAVRILEETR